jgi:SPP1 gp7 family putative phage head morphogenesis protein
LYNQRAVELLVHDDPDVIPWKVKIDVPKDLRWNKQHINNAITQGILQGESISRVAKRLQGVAQMNNTQAVRTARTAMTAANNAGHEAALKRAQNMGIKVKKQWLASLDNRTRDSHVALDGESVPLDKRFSNGLMYPGDPSGPPVEVYNCRCREIADVEGVDQGRIDDMTLRNNNKFGDMTYDEWKSYHQERLDRKKSKQALQQTS